MTSNGEAKLLRMAALADREAGIREVAPGILRLESGEYAFTLPAIRRILVSVTGERDMEALEVLLVGAALDAENVPRLKEKP